DSIRDFHVTGVQTCALPISADLLLTEPLDLAYEGHRARAFSLAVERKAPEALDVLNEGWTADWPFPVAYALDVARIRYLAGDYEIGRASCRVRGEIQVGGAR